MADQKEDLKAKNNSVPKELPNENELSEWTMNNGQNEDWVDEIEENQSQNELEEITETTWIKYTRIEQVNRDKSTK